MHADKKLYGTATVGTKGQVVIPVDAREELGIMPGDRLYVVGSSAKQWIGFIKEEEFRSMVDTILSRADSLRDVLDQVDKTEKDA